MSRLVVLSFGIGKLQLGFENVTARIYESGTSLDPQAMQFTGGLPAAPDIAEIYTHWQLVYSSFYKQFNPRIKINDAGDMKNISGVEFVELCSGLRHRINRWLNSEPFRKIDQQLRKLSTSEEIGFIIETDDPQLRRLPWHLWNFFEDYPKAEVALSAPEYQTARKRVTTTPSSKVRILAILGNREGIAVERDRGELEQRSDASTTFLVEPQLEELNEQLWSDGWDILFFAGHSSSADKGIFQLNEFDSIKLDKLRDALSRAISGGLKLAIFNSCDGLGLAEQLADLHIPQVIVMREPVPDVVATEFLKHFLEAFSSGQSLYASVRSAREQLKRLEIKYPTASWLPVICRNPAEPLTTWQEFCAPNSSDSTTVSTEPKSRPTPKKRRSKAKVLLASLAVTAGVMGVRHMGMLQNWELQAFDQLVRQRPDEKPDPRILAITITEDDLTAQNPKLKRGSISDWALNKVLEKLEQRQALVIGLDIYRDFPTPRKDLAARFQSERLVSVCKARDPESGKAVAPPPGVAPEKQGFSDVLQDDDGKVRRHLLAMDADETSRCTASYALSTGLALRYLAAKGVEASFTKEGSLQVGNVVFKHLQRHTSGYQGIDSWGYQVLLNYRSPRSPQNVVTQISLMQVLLGPLNPNLVKDRVVLIGVTAESSSDRWTTPYSLQESGRQLPGVLLQAQMVSQILSAVLDQRPLLWVWPIWGEALWIWGWAVLGGALALCWRSPVRLAMVVSFALGVLYALCFSLLAKGGWVPLVPSAIALVSTGGSVTIYTISSANDGSKKADKKV